MKGDHLLARAGVPDPDRLVVPSGDNALAIGTEANAIERASRTVKDKTSVRSGRVPDLDAPVEAGAGNPGSVRTEGHAQNRSAMALEAEFFLPGADVPNLERPKP
jgi:hypothetical protein